jgi:subtilisin family serine protease
MKHLFLAALLWFSVWGVSVAQESAVLDTMQYWHHLNPQTTGYYGVSTQEAYKFLAEKGRKSKPIIVAIIDSGSDIFHEDLKGVLWSNPGEIPDNNVDDDGNGYVDDVHGWNFLGNPKGENLSDANLEMTRILRASKSKFENKTMADMKTKEEIAAFTQYMECQKEYQKTFDKAQEEYKMVMQLWAMDSLVRGALHKDTYTIEDLQGFESTDKQASQVVNGMLGVFSNGLTRDDLIEYKDYVDSRMFYQLNFKFDPRPEFVGDNLNDLTQIFYGNKDAKGPRSNHGTHVAGIVAATRNNNLGIDGIADNVQLMIVRTVPDGDEYDKDVANAIYYAVKNGAKIINMSFGKSFTTQKQYVDAAIAYAEAHDVLMVHAAGNDGNNVDIEPNFPSPILNNKSKPVKNWITVGASAAFADGDIVANFSNYGKKNVDLFSPGVDVYSAYPENKYKKNSGTSMASPVAAGVAALVWSHYPGLTAVQLKKILMKSVTKVGSLKVNRPLSDKEKTASAPQQVVKFKTLSIAGGIVNALNAVQLAEKKTK